MKHLITIIILALTIHAQDRIAVVGLASDNPLFISAFTTAIQAQLYNKNFTVIERDRLAVILKQQGLRLSGLTATSQLPHIEDIDKIITGTIASINDSLHYVALKIANANNGLTINADYFTVKGPLENVLNTAPYAVDRLFKKNTYKNTIKEINISQIEIAHNPPKRKTFHICNLCQGIGTLHNGEDCPNCDRYSKYQGPDTHYRTVTGNWH